ILDILLTAFLEELNIFRIIDFKLNHGTIYCTVFLYSILYKVTNRIARRKGQFYELKKGGF
ncbi:hypothetical protein KUA00_17070, partial [Proteus mirabilis]|uniref:hypothetical protein n=1 Tax=Proteus mirabilis TaxID=584 RepID=UPI0021821628